MSLPSTGATATHHEHPAGLGLTPHGVRALARDETAVDEQGLRRHPTAARPFQERDDRCDFVDFAKAVLCVAISGPRMTQKSPANTSLGTNGPYR